MSDPRIVHIDGVEVRTLRLRCAQPIHASVSPDGVFNATGLNPSGIYVTASADGHVFQGKRVTLSPGKQSDLGTLRLFSTDFGFYVGAPPPKVAPLTWEKDYAAAEERSRREHRPLFVMMTATWCGPCKILENETLTDPWIRYFMSPFVMVKAYEDKNVEAKYGQQGYPTLVFVDSSGKVAHKLSGYMPAFYFASQCAKAFKRLSVEPPPELKKLVSEGVVSSK